MTVFFTMANLSAFAGGLCDECVSWTKVITLSGGIAWTQAGDTQTIYSRPEGSITQYIDNGHGSTMGTGELYFALQSPFAYGLLSQLGIGVGGTSEAESTGQISVNNVATGSNYEYSIYHTRLIARGKLLLEPKYSFLQPYITAAAGISFNRSYGFKTLPVLDPTLSPIYFNKRSTVGFTYSGGVGFQTYFNRHWQFGMGYEFSDWGKSQLGESLTYPWNHYGPELRHVYSHKGVISISYLC